MTRSGQMVVLLVSRRFSFPRLLEEEEEKKLAKCLIGLITSMICQAISHHNLLSDLTPMLVYSTYSSYVIIFDDDVVIIQEDDNILLHFLTFHRFDSSIYLNPSLTFIYLLLRIL